MADDELRQLERAWWSSGDREDRLRWLEAKARATGLSYDLHKLAVARFDPERLRADLELVLRDCVAELNSVKDESAFGAWRTATIAKLDDAADAHRLDGCDTGHWFHESYWQKSVLPKGRPSPSQIPELAAKALDLATVNHRCWAPRFEFLESLPRPLPADDFERAFRALAARSIEWVVETTGCDDAWYGDAAEILALVCQAVGVPWDDQAYEELYNLVEAHFDSWCAPAEEGVRAVIDSLTLSTLRRKFEDRYGPLD